MLLLVMIFLTETQTCSKSCVFVMGGAQNIKSLLEDCFLTMFSCSCCILYGFNMLCLNCTFWVFSY